MGSEEADQDKSIWEEPLAEAERFAGGVGGVVEGVRVMAAETDLVASAIEVALRATAAGLGIEAGAV